jgi:outer membrane receptor protein involved in Fe transport
MTQRIVGLLALLVFISAAGYGQYGKMRGRVTDKETKEALVGVTVALEATSLGASTDINGDYIVLNVPVGVYTVKASYVGYANVTISNIRVSQNVTTTQDFQLSTEAIQVEPVEIVAKRPLIQRNTTNTIRMTTQEDIQNLPIRGIQNIVALQAGVVQQNGNLFVRGGRNGEVSYFVNDANTTNPITSTNTVTVIQEAIEEVQVQAGGYTAEFGGANSAIIRTSLRSGTPEFHGSLDYQTDDFAKPGETFMGTSSFGYRNFVATLSGPIVTNNLKFFVAGEHNYLRDRQQRWMTPFSFEGLRVDENDARYRRDIDGNPLPADSQALLPGPVAFSENYVPNNSRENNTIQGSVSYDFSPFKLRASGSYSALTLPTGGDWTNTTANINALQNIYRGAILRTDQTKNGFGEIKFTHLVNTTTFYEVGASWINTNRRVYDPRFDNISSPGLPSITVGGQPFAPTFLDTWNTYTDSIANAAQGYTGFIRRFDGPNQWSTINGFQFNDPNAPNDRYLKTTYSSVSFSGDLTSQVSTNLELKAGGRYEQGTARNYNVAAISNAMKYLYGLDGQTPRSFASMDELEANLAKSSNGNINHYGYDVFGNETDGDGIDAPKKPVFAAAYGQGKLEYNDLILNLGLRFEYVDTKAKTFPNPETPDSFFNTSLDVIDYTKLVDADPFSLFLPRLSFSFPVTDNTVFYAMYGKYAQMPTLNQLYVGNTVQSRTVSPTSRGNAFLTPVGFLMKPEKTTQYEIGFRQTLTDNFAFTISGFYKNTKDMLSVRSVTDANGNAIYTAYLNQDFGTIKGVELTLELRRTARLAAQVRYTLSDARGTGSNAQSSFASIESGFGRATDFINPLTQNQVHRGSALFDYRWALEEGGPVLSGFGASVLMTFNSGHSYTRIKPPTSLGQANAWNVGVYPLTDPRFSVPDEPINASTTPWFFNIDLNLSKQFAVSTLNLTVYVNVLNIMNTQQTINVYPNTGTPQDDGWLTSPLASGFTNIPNYIDFYRAVNLQNQWAYGTTTGLDIYGTPRQIRFGIKAEL